MLANTAREEIRTFCVEHYRQWKRDPGYLGLGDRFSRAYPPSLFFGSFARLRHHEPTLVVLSLSPLLRRNAPPAYIEGLNKFARSEETYIRATIDYFSFYPSEVGKEAEQGYWRVMGRVASAWTGASPAVGVPWQLLAETVVEIPVIPLHASMHVHTWNAQLDALLEKRLELMCRLLRAPSVLALGRPIHTWLNDRAGSRSTLQLDRQNVIDTGDDKRVQTVMFKLRVDARTIPVISRTAALTNGWQIPKGKLDSIVSQWRSASGA